MQHPAAAVRGLAGQIVAVGQVVWGDLLLRWVMRVVLVEVRARRDQPGDRVARLAHQHARRRLVHQPRARRQRIAQVQFGIVVGANGGGQPTLGIAGIALAERRLGHQDDAQAGGQIERDGQPGDAAADDSDIAH